MPLATVRGSAVFISACSAVAVGATELAGGAPGMGGRRLKSGGITSGALVVTANSSGDFFCKPARLRMLPQPARGSPHSSRALKRLILEPLALKSAALAASAHRKQWPPHPE